MRRPSPLSARCYYFSAAPRYRPALRAGGGPPCPPPLPASPCSGPVGRLGRAAPGPAFRPASTSDWRGAVSRPAYAGPGLPRSLRGGLLPAPRSPPCRRRLPVPGWRLLRHPPAGGLASLPAAGALGRRPCRPANPQAAWSGVPSRPACSLGCVPRAASAYDVQSLPLFAALANASGGPPPTPGARWHRRSGAPPAFFRRKSIGPCSPPEYRGRAGANPPAGGQPCGRHSAVLCISTAGRSSAATWQNG